MEVGGGGGESVFSDSPALTFADSSAEPDVDWLAGDDQGAGGWPACGYRDADPRDADGVYH